MAANYKVFDKNISGWVKTNYGDIRYWHYLSEASEYARSIGGQVYNKLNVRVEMSPVPQRKTWEFTITLVGEGNSEAEAWEDVKPLFEKHVHNGEYTSCTQLKT